MAATMQCFDRTALRQAFMEGSSADVIENLATHIEQCTHCGEMFDELLRSDAVATGLSLPGIALGDADSTAVKILRERLADLRPLSATAVKTVGMDLNDTGGSTPAADDRPFLLPPQAPDEIGRLGSYRILKKLGAGGMGMVFLAEDTMLKRKVALKTMLPTLAVNRQARERFLREARAAAAIEHPHIITIHQVGEDGGVPYLAMPFLKGESLDDRLKRLKKLPLHEALQIACEMAEGLAAAHAQGLIHRDIKPGNVWLEDLPVRASTAPATRRPFSVRLLDFGLARSEAEETQLTQPGAIVGTPAFMAPEQARGVPVDGRADLFSLGAVLYLMLTGERPFTGQTVMALLTALATDTPRSPRDINPEIPTALSDLTMRLLARAPADRPASADVVADELRDLAPIIAEAKKTALIAAPATATFKAHSLSSAATKEYPAAAAPAKMPEPPAPKRQWTRSLAVVTLALLGLIGGGLAAYQLIFKTKDGTLLVEVDGDADVRFQKGELRIYDTDGQLKYTLKPSERNRLLPPGKYLVEVAGADGLKVLTDKFEIVRGNQTAVRVTVDAVALAAQQDDDRRRAEGWVSLFNGKDLTGWKKRTDDRNWRVENGILIGSGGEHNTFLFSDRGDWANFRLRVETRINLGGSGGVMGRAQLETGHTGYLAKINVKDSPDPRKTGSLYVMDKDSYTDGVQIDSSAIMPDEWFTLDLIVDGNRVVIKVNDKVTTDYRDEKRRFTSGNIALQVYNQGAQIEFRKIEIQSLPANSGNSDRPSVASPLDKLDATKVPAAERFPWQPKELVAVIGEHRQRHWGACAGIALSPNGQLLASVATYESRVRLWDPATMDSVGELEVPDSGMNSLAFSPDGQWLAVASGSRFYLWDARKNPPRLIHSLEVEGGYNHLGFAHGGDILVGGFGGSGKLVLWDPGFNPPKILASVDGHKGLRQLAIAPGGKLIATAGSDKLVKLWDLAERKPKEIAALKGHEGDIHGLAFSSDGKLLFTGDEAKMFRIWGVDGPNTKEKSKFTQPEWHVWAGLIACDETGGRIVIGSHSGFTICTHEEGIVDPLYFTRTENSWEPFTALAWGLLGKVLFAGNEKGVVQRYDVGQKKLTPVNDLPLDALCGWGGSAVSQTGTLAMGHRREVHVWDLNAPAPRLRGKALLDGERGAISMSANGAFMACIKGTSCELWDLRGQGEPRKADEFRKFEHFISSLWRPDGKTLVASSHSGLLLLLEWDGDKLKVRNSFPIAKAGFGVALSPDAKTLATWGWESGAGLRLWSLNGDGLQEKAKLELPTQLQGAALSSDGRTLAVCSTNRAKLYDFSGAIPREAAALETVDVQSVCFSPDGKTLAGCGFAGELVFWDTTTGKKTREWRLPGLIHGAAFADDGRHLFTINSNGTVYVLRLVAATSAGRDGDTTKPKK